MKKKKPKLFQVQVRPCNDVDFSLLAVYQSHRQPDFNVVFLKTEKVNHVWYTGARALYTRACNALECNSRNKLGLEDMYIVVMNMKRLGL